MRERDISIDLLKCVAAIIITNSHMELLYGDYAWLATGGAIGDGLFFFCSGYTLFLGRGGDFFNWYKRRINRIYPTVFAWGVIQCIFKPWNPNILGVILNGGGWFVSCIMIYYILLWLIRRYVPNKLYHVFFVSLITVIVIFYLIDRPSNYNVYGENYFKWITFFPFMLLGAIIGLKTNHNNIITPKLVTTIVKLLISSIIFYTLFICRGRGEFGDEIQVLTVVPLLGICYYFYVLCNVEFIKSLYNLRVMGSIIRFIGGLCLEIYLVQFALFTDTMNHYFPLNLLIMFIIILIGAYLLRCISRIWAQTFKDSDYNWKSIVQPY